MVEELTEIGLGGRSRGGESGEGEGDCSSRQTLEGMYTEGWEVLCGSMGWPSSGYL